MMADKDLQMTQRNADNTGWDNLHPKTTGANVKTQNGASNIEADLTAHAGTSASTSAKGHVQLSSSLTSTSTSTAATSSAVKALNDAKAPIASPTFTGTAKVTDNTNYTTSQLRNVKFDTVIPTTLANGEICFVYE